ncbi:MAG: HAD-IB family hydrolase, partial [Candidatus Bathyarchaeia archaeon]
IGRMLMDESEKDKGFSNRAAFFDLDGTLIKGFMIRSFPRYLAQMGKIKEEIADNIDLIVSAYERGDASYSQVARKVPALYASGIKGLKISLMSALVRDFVDDYVPRNLFSYSKGLLDAAKSCFNLVIAISGSPQEVVEELKGKLGFDEGYGSLFTTNRSGAYTGTVKRNLILGSSKGRLLERLANSRSIDLSNSIAFGDTEEDEPLLRRVGRPIALNPNFSLLKICQKNGWPWYTEDRPPRLEILLQGFPKDKDDLIFRI